MSTGRGWNCFPEAAKRRQIFPRKGRSLQFRSIEISHACDLLMFPPRLALSSGPAFDVNILPISKRGCPALYACRICILNDKHRRDLFPQSSFVNTAFARRRSTLPLVHFANLALLHQNVMKSHP